MYSIFNGGYLTKNFRARDVIDSTCTEIGDFVVEYIRDFEAEFTSGP
jgi:hypothetical protein